MKFILDTVLNFIRSHPLMDESVGHEHGKPAFFIRDLTFTHLVVDSVPVPLARHFGDTYRVYFAGTSKLQFSQIV